MSALQRMSDGSHLYVAKDGEVQVTRLGAGLLHMRLKGHATSDMHGSVIALFDKELETGKQLTFFVDGYDFESYEGAFRTDWIQWLKKNPTKVQKIPMLVRSVMVRMGMQVVNFATGNMLEPYSDRSAFEDAVRQHAPRWKG